MQTKITSSAHQRTVSYMISSCVTRYQAVLDGFLVTKSDWYGGYMTPQCSNRAVCFVRTSATMGRQGKIKDFPSSVGMLTKTWFPTKNAFKELTCSVSRSSISNYASIASKAVCQRSSYPLHSVISASFS